MRRSAGICLLAGLLTGCSNIDRFDIPKDLETGQLTPESIAKRLKCELAAIALAPEGLPSEFMPTQTTLSLGGNLTGWLPHSTRAALTGLRKSGFAIERSRDPGSQASVYRIASPVPAATA